MTSLPKFTFALLLALVVALPAHAQSDPLDALSDADATRVLELLQEARAAEADGAWLNAWEAYRDVHRVVALPEVRLREANALEELGRFEDAARVYEALEEGGGEVAGRAQDALARLHEDHPAVIEVSVVGLPVAVSIDGDDPATVTTTRRFPVAPGVHHVTVSAEGHADTTYSETVGLGDVASRVFSYTAVASAPPVDALPEVREQSPSLVAPLIVGGLGVAAIGTGAGLFARAQGAADDTERESRAGTLDADRYAALGDRYDRSRAGGTAAVVVGGALVVGAAVLVLVRPGADGADDVARAPQPWFDGAGGGVSWSTTW